MKLNLGRDSEAKFGRYLDFLSLVEMLMFADIEFLKLVRGQYSEDSCFFMGAKWKYNFDPQALSYF